MEKRLDLIIQWVYVCVITSSTYVDKNSLNLKWDSKVCSLEDCVLCYMRYLICRGRIPNAFSQSNWKILGEILLTLATMQHYLAFLKSSLLFSFLGVKGRFHEGLVSPWIRYFRDARSLALLNRAFVWSVCISQDPVRMIKTTIVIQPRELTIGTRLNHRCCEAVC